MLYAGRIFPRKYGVIPTGILLVRVSIHVARAVDEVDKRISEDQVESVVGEGEACIVKWTGHACQSAPRNLDKRTLINMPAVLFTRMQHGVNLFIKQSHVAKSLERQLVGT